MLLEQSKSKIFWVLIFCSKISVDRNPNILDLKIVHDMLLSLEIKSCGLGSRIRDVEAF